MESPGFYAGGVRTSACGGRVADREDCHSISNI